MVMLAVFLTFCLSYFLLTLANIWLALTSTPRMEIKMLDIPGGVIGFAGIVWAGKEIQKIWGEAKSPTPSQNPPKPVEKCP
jgi:hypothetical protein